VRRLLSRLRPGQVGCLLGGVFAEDVSIYDGGRPGAPLVLRSAPRTRATVRGIFFVADSANDVVVRNLRLDGANTSAHPSVQINGDRVTLRGNDITNGNSAICVILGSASQEYGRANDVTLRGNRIHDCGRLPATGFDHGVYVEDASRTRIVGNYIYDNADWGVHLYPAARQTLVERNVIDGNGRGLIVAGDESAASSDTLVRGNIVSNSALDYNIKSWWEGPVGTNNVVEGNCLWNGQKGNIDGARGGLTVGRNKVADPRYVDRDAKRFQLRPDSRCAGMGP